MSGFANNLLFFLVAIAVLITFHELGHFAMARWAGIKVLKFSVGFGRPIYRRVSATTGTEYAIGILPLGGYVRMLDEREGEVEGEELVFAFNRQSLLKRTAVVSAGPLANFLLAFLLYWGALVAGSADLAPVVGEVAAESVAARAGFATGDRLLAVDGRAIEGWAEHRLYLLDRALRRKDLTFQVMGLDQRDRKIAISGSVFSGMAFNPRVLEQQLGLLPEFPVLPPIVGAVIIDSPAARAGLQAGDTITAVAGVQTPDWGSLVQRVAGNAGRVLELSVIREGVVTTLSVVPEEVIVEGRKIGRIGIQSAPGVDPPAQLVRVRYSIGKGAWRGAETTWLMSSLTIRMVVRMLSGEASSENLSGPVAIARYAGQSAKLGVVQFVLFLAVLSVSLGVLNLLPIPVLDGGHLLYFVIEAIKGSPVSETVMQWGQQVGLGIIAVLMGLAIYNDILSLLF